MKIFLYSWALTLLLILALDIIWFSLTIEGFYKPYLGHMVSGDFNYNIALIFYFLYAFGISYLIITPSLLLNDNVLTVLCKGFVLGIVSYAAYNLTNHATIKNWPSAVTIVDTLWGGILTSSAASMTYRILAKLL